MVPAGWAPVQVRSPSLLRFLRRQPLAAGGAAIVAGLVAAALLAPVLAPSDPFEQNLYQRLAPPSLSNPLGTDEFGRDIFSRILYGARISLRIGIVCIAIALTSGTLIGVTAGYFGGAVDTALMRVVDLMLAFPSILLAIAVVSVIGPGIDNAIVAVGIVLVPQFARLMRATVLAVAQMPYVEAARALGAGDRRIVLRAILPNCLAPLIVQGSISLATAILDAAGLSFLGLGAQPPAPEWGAMLNSGRELLIVAPWVMVFPGLAIFVVALGFNLFGDGLRDLLDPRTAEGISPETRA